MWVKGSIKTMYTSVFFTLCILISAKALSMNAEELREKAWARHELGEHEEALALLDEAIKVDPTFARA